MRLKAIAGGPMYLDGHGDTRLPAAGTEQQANAAVPSTAAKPPLASRLFATLISNVDRRRLFVDHMYFNLVSDIAELLSDEEIALLALYFAPPLAIGVPSREHRLAVSIMRGRKSGKRHA